jgi:protein O-GlcNAc transferase
MAQVTIQHAFDLAVQHHQAGRVGEAEAIYRQILAAQPKNANALHLLGVIAGQGGRNEEAARLIRRAITAVPENAEYHCNLGIALRNLGQLEEAVGCFKRALSLKSDYAEAYNNFGVALASHGQLDQAIACYKQALGLKPGSPQMFNNLGNAWRLKGQLNDAIECYRRALALRPGYPNALNNLGQAMAVLGQFEEAIKLHKRALALQPDDPESLNYLSVAFLGASEFDQAIACCRKAVALKPDYFLAHCNFGMALACKCRLDEAVDCYRRALALKPNSFQAHNSLGIALGEMGQVDEAIASYRRALAIKPDCATAHSNILLTMLYQPTFNAGGLLAESRDWDRRHAQALERSIVPAANECDPERRLRVGYVSPDLRDHCVGRYLLPLLAAHDRGAVEVFCYAQVPHPDEVTAKVRALADQWRSTVGLTDQQLADVIRQDGIDILVDLAGHTANNRLLVFARRPAPVQINYMGYPATTGLAAMDYRFTDALADPVGGDVDSFYAEKLIRLPQSTWCCPEPENAPPVTNLSAVRTGRVMFGSFNNFAKVNEPLLKLWAKILQATPSSRLLLKAKGLASEAVRKWVREVMSQNGIESDRIELSSFVSAADHLARYGQVDIALDTYPYHGTTTTCEALWMGVPVVSLAGENHVSRVGVSLLTNVGRPELVARTPAEYVKIAAGLAADLPRLAEIRSTLRERMRQSPLMDARRFACDVEEAYRNIWRKWCEKS